MGVKFCGHCAPRMDMMEFFEELQGWAREVDFRYFSADEPVDVLLILNACQVECASRPPFPGPVVVVSPDTVNHWPTARERLSQQTICGLLQYRTDFGSAAESPSQSHVPSGTPERPH